MSEIKVGNTIYTDTMNKIHKETDHIECCNKYIRMVCHTDGKDFYRYTYSCKCGNVINADTKKR